MITIIDSSIDRPNEGLTNTLIKSMKIELEKNRKVILFLALTEVIPKKLMSPETVVYDIVYKPVNTELIKDYNGDNRVLVVQV